MEQAVFLQEASAKALLEEKETSGRLALVQQENRALRDRSRSRRNGTSISDCPSAYSQASRPGVGNQSSDG